MVKKNTVQADLKGLNDLVASVKENFFVKIGILGKNAQREGDSGLTNTEIGLKHEFGSASENLPARSFLRFPLEFRGKELVSYITKRKNIIMKQIVTGNFKAIYAELGFIAEGIIQQAFTTGGFGQWQALSQRTINEKGSSQPLIDTGQLRRSITSKVIKKK